MSEHTDALNAEQTDDQIAAQIATHDDPNHAGATTVGRVRDLLAALAEATQEGWDEYIGGLGDSSHVICETDDLVLVDTGETRVYDIEIEHLPHAGYRDVERDVINAVMHELANALSDRRWPASHPMVLAKPDSFGAGQDYVEAVINSLQSEGLSPGQAWAFYGVEIKGQSQSAWARRQGREQQQISKAIKSAKSKLGWV